MSKWVQATEVHVDEDRVTELLLAEPVPPTASFSGTVTYTEGA